MGEQYFKTYDTFNKPGDSADRKCLVTLLIGNFSGPCPECSLTRIMVFLEFMWHQKGKNKEKKLTLCTTSRDSFVKNCIPPPKPEKINKCTLHSRQDFACLSSNGINRLTESPRFSFA